MPQQSPSPSHAGNHSRALSSHTLVPVKSLVPLDPDFLAGPQLRRLVIPAEPRSIRPSSPRVFRHCFPAQVRFLYLSNIPQQTFTETSPYKGSIPAPNSGHLSTFPFSNFFSESFFSPLFSFVASYSLSSTSPTIWCPSFCPECPPKLTQRPPSKEQRSRTAPCFTSHLCSRGPGQAIPPRLARP